LGPLSENLQSYRLIALPPSGWTGGKHPILTKFKHDGLLLLGAGGAYLPFLSTEIPSEKRGGASSPVYTIFYSANMLAGTMYNFAEEDYIFIVMDIIYSYNNSNF